VSRPTFIPRVAYTNLNAAVAWLEKAFGFVTTLTAKDNDGNIVHAEMVLGTGTIRLGGEWENTRSPGALGGANTQTVTVEIDDLDGHFERARAAGGVIVQEPTDQFHGDRTYRVADPEGHVWQFSKRLRDVTVSEMEAALPGIKVWMR
jgi:uncharacterized glyoxalase superfamily protein PhnB